MRGGIAFGPRSWWRRTVAPRAALGQVGVGYLASPLQRRPPGPRISSGAAPVEAVGCQERFLGFRQGPNSRNDGRVRKDAARRHILRSGDLVSLQPHLSRDGPLPRGAQLMHSRQSPPLLGSLVARLEAQQMRELLLREFPSPSGLQLRSEYVPQLAQRLDIQCRVAQLLG